MLSNKYLIPNEVLTKKLIMQVTAGEKWKHFLCFLDWNCDTVSSTSMPVAWGFVKFLFYLSCIYGISAFSANTWMIMSFVINSVIYNTHFLTWRYQFLRCIQNYFIKNGSSLCTKDSEVLVRVSETCHTVLKARWSWHISCHISFWQERIWKQILFYVNNSKDTTESKYVKVIYNLESWYAVQ